MSDYLFIHGWATDPWVWEDAAGDLSGGGVSSIFLNLPGHGGREVWDAPDLSPGVRAAAAEIERRPAGSLVAVGWSLGGQVLLGLPPEVKARLRAMVLVGATPSFTEREGFACGQPRAQVRRMIMEMKKDPGAATARFYPLNFTGRELGSEEAKGFLARYGYPGPVECGDGSDGGPPGCYPLFRYSEISTALEALYNTDLRDRLDEVRAPTLVVHGALDSVCPVEAGRYLAGRIAGSRLEVFEEAGHAPFITERRRFVELLRGFTGELKRGAG